MLADRIKLLREKNGDKQSELAKKLYVTRSSVNAWEMGISTPSSQNIAEIATLYGVSTDYLFGLESDASISVKGLSDRQVGVLIELINCFREDETQREARLRDYPKT